MLLPVKLIPRFGRFLLPSLAIVALLSLACTSVSDRSSHGVTITRSTTTWETYDYELTDFGTIRAGSFDGVSRVEKAFDIWVLENKYLKVTLLPDFGGRILSIIYKPTGHEELYQNPVGVPYQIDTNIFYYNWLMVYGGIFPTFPEPEHGKSWLMSWDFEIIEETKNAVTVAMSYTDDGENKLAPRQYNTGITGLKVTYFITLSAGRTALDTEIVIENPGEMAATYEYWTNTTLAPGSDPLSPQTTAQAEIIAPVNMVRIPAYWTAIASQEKRTGLPDVYEFSSLRQYKNWPDMGIAYAFPDISQSNFWGVINHENEEGIFRIADNTITPGMKIWTWGYPQTVDVDPYAAAQEARPYIELWAGVTREFWQRTELLPGNDLRIEEVYSPSIGLSNVTHANHELLVNLAADATGGITCQIFGLNPDKDVEVTLFINDEVLYQDTMTLDPANGNECSPALPDTYSQGMIRLLVQDQTGAELFTGSALAADN